MEILKWKLLIKKLDNINRIIIYSLNQNNLIYLKENETEIHFYTLKNQKNVLMQIDNTFFTINLNNNKHNFEFANIVKAILFYKNIDSSLINFNKQNKIKDRYIYNRKYNTLIPEYSNGIIFILIRNILNNSYFGSNYISSLLTYFLGLILKTNLSSFMVDIFIKKYNINTQKYIIHGLTFNDFFIRELKQPLTILKNNDTIYSPVTSRSLFYNFKNFYKLNLFIKGKNFTISKLINEKKILPKYSVIINRLAIQDYHHIHMPEDGILINITEINGTNISVDKDFINSEINVLNENKRVIFKFKRNDGSIFYLILIGSLLVASIKYDLELNKKYYTHEKIAFFQFGGSCVVYISDRNIFIDDDLSYFTNEEIESYVKVGEEIGNINNQSKKNFIKNYNIKKHIIGFFNNIIEIIINLIVKINNKLIKNIIMI